MARKGITIQVIGTDKAVKTFEKLDKKAIDGVKQSVIGSAFKIETEAKRKAPSDTGRLRSSIQTEIRKNGFEAVIFTDVEYALPVEEGTVPHFPPPNALSGWANRHGLNGLEFIIARAIARRGLPPRPFLFPSWDNERPNFINSIKAVARRLERG